MSEYTEEHPTEVSASDLVWEILADVSSFSIPELDVKCERICRELKTSGIALPILPTLNLLNELKEERAFASAAKLADRLIVLGRCEPEVRKLMAQCLIEVGHLRAALDSLEVLLNTTERNHPEHIEALNLKGRCFKQIYCDAEFQGDTIEGLCISPAMILNDAIRSYYSAYMEVQAAHPGTSKWTYSAINVVALLERARIDGVPVEGIFDQKLLAQSINDAIVGRGDLLGRWDFATLGEAHLALQDWDRAAGFYKVFADHPKTEAFHLASSARQLGEVWLTEQSHEEVKKLYAYLTEILLEKEGGNFELNPKQRDALLKTVESEVGYEAVFRNHSDSKPLVWLKTGLELSKSVCQICYRNSGYPKGTGFVVRGGDLDERLGDEKLLLTNAHILSSREAEICHFAQPAIHFKKAQVNFTSEGLSERKFGCAEVIAESPREELDFALVRLHPGIPDDIPICSFATSPLIADESRVLIVGHPAGRPLEISFFDRPVLDLGAKGSCNPGYQYLHYSNPTSGGSSGSPIFNEEWEIVGLHHAGPHPESQTLGRLNGLEGEHQANEGISIISISESVTTQIGL